MGKSSLDRRCPRCGGNIIIDRDYHGWYEECLQCSFMRDLKVIYDNRRKKAGTKTGHSEPSAPER